MACIHICKVLTYWQKRTCQSAHRCVWVWTYNLRNRDLTPKPVCTLSPKTLLAFMFLSHEQCAVCHNSLQSNVTVQNTLQNLPYLLCNLLRKRNACRSHQSLVKHMYGVEEGTSSLWTIKIKVCGFTLNKTASLCINLHVKGLCPWWNWQNITGLNWYQCQDTWKLIKMKQLIN